MERRSHVLIDAERSLVADGTVFQGRDLSGGTRDWTVRLRTCRGGRSEGVQVVEIDNGQLLIDILPTRGMGIWRVRRIAQTLGWRSPTRGPVHPAFVPLYAPSGLGWLDGFDELVCRCGLESNGPPIFDDAGKLLHPLHGRIANLPAHFVELIVDEVARTLTIRGIVDESRFHFQSLRLTSTLTTSFDSSEFAWTDEVQNIGGRDATLQMLYHINLGQPLLGPGAQLDVPLGAVAPLTRVAADAGIDTWNTMPSPQAGSSEQVYCCQPAADDSGNTRVMATGLTDRSAIALYFNTRMLPCFTVWRNTPAEADGYVMGIEPGTNFPNPHAFERRHGRVITLAPGETWTSGRVAVAWVTDPGAIAAHQQAIRTIQGERKPNLAIDPRSDWSSNA
jgi:hypothetical protein